MGHATIAITLNLYGHLMPGAEDEAIGLLDAFLCATMTARLRAISRCAVVCAVVETL
jgi:hypothetical protein